MVGMANATSTQVSDGGSSLSPPTYNFDLVAYVVVGILGALIWEVFSNLGEDYELIQRSSIGLPIIVYLSSRITTLLCFVLMVIFSTATNVNCNHLIHAIQWTFVFGLSLTTLLLLLRARAVYKNQKFAANLLSIMWLGVVATSLVQTRLGFLPLRHEPSGRCITSGNITPFIIAATVVPVANDIVIFCAITWKLVQNSLEELNVKKKLMIAVFGHHLPSFSKALLRDGQAYFLTTVVVSITTISVFCIAPQTVSGYSSLLAFINIGVMHLMACKIYRKTRLGVRRPETAVNSAPSLEPMEFRSQMNHSSSAAHANGEDTRSENLPPRSRVHRSWHGDFATDGDADVERHKMGDADEDEVDVAEGKID